MGAVVVVVVEAVEEGCSGIYGEEVLVWRRLEEEDEVAAESR